MMIHTLKVGQLLTLVTLTLLGCVLEARGRQIIDLTYNMKKSETIDWPGDKKFELEVMHAAYSDNGIFIAYNAYKAGGHGGTHMDAPKHMGMGPGVDQVPIEHMIAPGVRIDFREKAGKHENAVLDVDDLVKWEEENGEIPDKSVVLLYSGWGKYWKDEDKFLGKYGPDGDKYKFPGLSGDAAEWLVKKRNVVGVGTDTGSIDNGPSTTYPAHVVLMKNRVFILEMVANLDQLPGPRGFTIMALPMKIYDGTGAPTRFLAISGDDGVFSGSTPLQSYVFILLLSFLSLILKNVF